MLYYKNSRFHFGGMSFALPENILIDTDYERDTPNGFAFLSHDRKIRITVSTQEVTQSLKDYIKSDDFAENGFTEVETPVLIKSTNRGRVRGNLRRTRGLFGHSARILRNAA